MLNKSQSINLTIFKMDLKKLSSSFLISIAAIGTTSLVLPNESKSAACPTGSDLEAISTLSEFETETGGDCRGTPDEYGLTVYKMGFCTANPAAGGSGSTPDYSTCTFTFENTSGEYTSFAAGGTNNLATSSRPANGTYEYAIIQFGKDFKLKVKYGPWAGGETYYSTSQSPSGSTPNTSTSEDDWDTYTAPLETFSDGTTCASISTVDSDNSDATLTGYLLDSSGDVIVNSGASGSCSGVEKVLGVALFSSGNEVTITENTTALKANFTVTNRGTTIYIDNTGSNLVMDSGPFDVKFEVE